MPVWIAEPNPGPRLGQSPLMGIQASRPVRTIETAQLGKPAAQSSQCRTQSIADKHAFRPRRPRRWGKASASARATRLALTARPKKCILCVSRSFALKGPGRTTGRRFRKKRRLNVGFAKPLLFRSSPTSAACPPSNSANSVTSAMDLISQSISLIREAFWGGVGG